MCVYVCVCQTKVSKLVVQIGDVDEDGQRIGGDLNSTQNRTQSQPGQNNIEDGTRRGERSDELVRVCSWSDRRDNSNSRFRRQSTTAKSSSDNVMPSVKELAKQFSSNQVSVNFLHYINVEC